LNEQRRSPNVVRFPGNVMIFPWIRRTEPTANILLQLVTCQTITVISGGNGNVTEQLTFQLVHITRNLM
jgi:hypothetical protein